MAWQIIPAIASALGKAAGAAGSAIGSAAGAVGSGIGQAAGAVGQGLGGLAQGIGPALAEGVGFIAPAAQGAGPAAASLGQGFIPGLGEAAGMLGSVGQGALPAAGEALAGMPGVLAGAGQGIAPVGQAVGVLPGGFANVLTPAQPFGIEPPLTMGEQLAGATGSWSNPWTGELAGMRATGPTAGGGGFGTGQPYSLGSPMGYGMQDPAALSQKDWMDYLQMAAQVSGFGQGGGGGGMNLGQPGPTMLPMGSLSYMPFQPGPEQMTWEMFL